MICSYLISFYVQCYLTYDILLSQAKITLVPIDPVLGLCLSTRLKILIELFSIVVYTHLYV